LYWSDGSDYAVLSSGPDGRWDSNYYVIDPSEWAHEPGDDVILGARGVLKGPQAHRERQKRTMADLRSIATAIEEFSIDNNYYPDTLGTVDLIEALSPYIVPTYIRSLPRTDGWGNRFLGWSAPEHYVIYSVGSDGVPDTPYSYGHPFPAEWGGKTSTYSSDIVFSNGSFIQWPEGKQN
jgi:general secretion pathway protein G